MLNPIKAAFIISQMKRNQWKTRGEIEELQQHLLRKIIKHAKENVPFYKNLEGNGLGGFPIVEKTHILPNAKEFINKNIPQGNLTCIHTSGSSGIPGVSYYDASDGLYASVLRYHQLTECGFGPLDKMAEIMHNKEPKNILQKLGIFRINQMSPTFPVDDTFEKLLEVKPDFILTYPSVLTLLAKRNDKEGRPIKLRGAFLQSEMLRPPARLAMAESFGADVRNSYSSNETRNIAWECECGSMHINSDSVIVEILDDKNKPVKHGESGNIIVTPLWKYAMPLIRYRIGDLGSLGGACKCGRGSHILKTLEGRDNDFVVDLNGNDMAPGKIELVVGYQKGVLQYQIVQDEEGKITAHTIVQKGITREDLESKIQKALPELEVTVEISDDLPRTTAGKVKCVFSKLKS